VVFIFWVNWGNSCIELTHLFIYWWSKFISGNSFIQLWSKYISGNSFIQIIHSLIFLMRKYIFIYGANTYEVFIFRVNWGNSCIELIHLFIYWWSKFISGNSIVEQIHSFIYGANTYMTYINLLSQYIHSFIYWVNTVIYLFMKQIQILYFI